MGERERALLERIYAQWGRGDYTSGEFLHDDFTLVITSSLLDEGVYRGPREAWRGWKQWLGQWSSWEYEAKEFIEVDDTRIAVLIDIHGTSRSTGIELDAESGNVWEFEDGLVKRLALYGHRDEMLRDLGLDLG